MTDLNLPPIACTTLTIMTPHTKTFTDIDELCEHLAAIRYLHRTGTAHTATRTRILYAAEPGVTLTPVQHPEHDGYAYIIAHATRGGQRAHRIDTGDHHEAVMFENRMCDAGVQLA